MKLGVWGLGSIGLRHAKNAMALGPDVIGFDPDSARGTMLVEAGGKIVANEESLLSQSDAVVICSPNHLHFDHLKQAIDNGCHALIEKPLSHTDKGLEVLFQAAEGKGLVIAPAMNMRFDGVVQRVKEIVDSGDFLKPLWARFVCSSYLPSWRPHQDHRKGYTNDPKTGGVIFDIIHEFDMAHYILGEMNVVSCAAHNSGSIGLDVEDCADINLISERDKAAVSIHLDYISQVGQRYFEIQFSEHYLRADLDSRKIDVSDKDGQIVLSEDVSQSDVQCYSDEMASFIAATQGKAPYLCTADDALKVLRNVVKARELAGLPAS